MGWISDLRDGLTVARALIQHLDDIREGLDLVAEMRVRNGRGAEIGDLRDTLAKLRALNRRRG